MIITKNEHDFVTSVFVKFDGRFVKINVESPRQLLGLEILMMVIFKMDRLLRRNGRKNNFAESR